MDGTTYEVTVLGGRLVLEHWPHGPSGDANKACLVADIEYTRSFTISEMTTAASRHTWECPALGRG